MRARRSVLVRTGARGVHECAGDCECACGRKYARLCAFNGAVAQRSNWRIRTRACPIGHLSVCAATWACFTLRPCPISQPLCCTSTEPSARTLTIAL
eukprot:5431395-Pleurochrysis_carterae.AAC.1